MSQLFKIQLSRGLLSRTLQNTDLFSGDTKANVILMRQIAVAKAIEMILYIFPILNMEISQL